jgi:bifunctional DNA-binding transcriptional regulator/antitoxin component of YhaV-PrlF toxin-antitoxin module
MTKLTVTARGQVTFTKEVLQHLGIRPGEKIELDLLPDGRGVLRAARQTGTIAGFVGLLAGRTAKVATIEEINAASVQGAAFDVALRCGKKQGDIAAFAGWVKLGSLHCRGE